MTLKTSCPGFPVQFWPTSPFPCWGCAWLTHSQASSSHIVTESWHFPTCPNFYIQQQNVRQYCCLFRSHSDASQHACTRGFAPLKLPPLTFFFTTSNTWFENFSYLLPSLSFVRLNTVLWHMSLSRKLACVSSSVRRNCRRAASSHFISCQQEIKRPKSNPKNTVCLLLFVSFSPPFSSHSLCC